MMTEEITPSDPGSEPGTSQAEQVRPAPASGITPRDFANGAVRTCRWLASHPGRTTCGVAAVLAAMAAWVVAGDSGFGVHVIAAFSAAAIASALAAAIILRIRYSRGRLPVRVAAADPDRLAARGDDPGLLPVPGIRLPAPQDMAEALELADAILASLRPGPELVSAADPDSTPVTWDSENWRDRDRNLDPARADKMRVICGRVRREAARMGVLHQLPQLLLAADDGAVVELFGDGGLGRTGITAPAWVDSTPAARA